MEAFDAMSLADAFIAEGLRTSGLRIFANGRPLAHLEIDDIESPFPFVLVLPQSETERLLGARAEQLGVQIERRTELLGFDVSDGTVNARLRAPDGEQVCRAKWLAGCDGAHSAVRHALNMPFEGTKFPEVFVVSDLYLDDPVSESELRIDLGAGGLLGIVPMRGGIYRVFANLSETPPNAEPTLADVQALLDQRSSRGFRAHDPVWLGYFQIHRRIVPNMMSDGGHVFLAGDAAHIHSPAGGQGMNTGIQDAFNLGWKLSAVASGQSSPSLLETYSLERLPIARSVLRGTDILTRIVALQNPLARSMRDHLVPLLMSISPLRRRAENNLSEVAIAYPDSPLTHDAYRSSGSAPGSHVSARALCPALRTGDWRLLWFARNAGADRALRAATEHIAAATGKAGIQPTPLIIVPDGQTPPSANVIGADASLLARYDASSTPLLYLVRPDGYIGLRARADDVETLRKYWSEIALPKT
jgi:2-polyprenyl-6-methoxyphenol hydroxylase-like FAD-dependent oxidoreductase